MSHHKADHNGTMFDDAPLFASVWLALFNELRKNYVNRRFVAPFNADGKKTTEKK